MDKPPTGGKAFDALARKLIQVPKAEVNQEVNQEAKKRRAKLRRRKKS
jgi:hypothetical protein